MERILRFVADRWERVASDPESGQLEGLPSDFWMNSAGGRTAKGGYWVTSLLYTESGADAEAFREVMLRWQSKGSRKDGPPDLIQIGRGGQGR